MKRFILKSLSVLLTIVMIIGALWTVGSLVIQFLPGEITTKIFNALHINPEMFASFTISTAISTLSIWIAKLIQFRTTIRLAELRSDQKSEIRLVDEKLEQSNKRDDLIIDRMNDLEKQNMAIIKQNEIILEGQRITARVRSKSKLIDEEDKTDFKENLKHISELENQLPEIQLIKTVETKIVEVEVPVESNSSVIRG